jgi:hypothetical protein
MALGDYTSSLQSTAMTRKRPDAGAANPDIMAIRNKRFIYMAELMTVNHSIHHV